MLAEVGTRDRVPAFLESVRSRERRLMGFGYRIQESYNPRAKIIKRNAYEVFEITLELERIAPQEEGRPHPDVDFYSGIIYEALGFLKFQQLERFPTAQTSTLRPLRPSPNPELFPKMVGCQCRSAVPPSVAVSTRMAATRKLLSP